MPINWQDSEVKDRLLAAIIASMGGTVNCTLIARLYGPDATYNAIENFLRKPKAKAKELVKESEGRGIPGKSNSMKKGKGGGMMTPTAMATKKDGVKTGRVWKVEKGKGKMVVKEEVLEEVFGGGEEGEGEREVVDEI